MAGGQGYAVYAEEEKLTSSLVYGAVHDPREMDRKWQGYIRLFKRLGAGMLLVSMEPEPRVVQLLAPSIEERPTRKTMTKTLWREIAGRTVDVNAGGSPGWNHMDAYKEKALRIAVAIERFGPSPKHVPGPYRRVRHDL